MHSDFSLVGGGGSFGTLNLPDKNIRQIFARSCLLHFIGGRGLTAIFSKRAVALVGVRIRIHN